MSEDEEVEVKFVAVLLLIVVVIGNWLVKDRWDNKEGKGEIVSLEYELSNRR